MPFSDVVFIFCTVTLEGFFCFLWFLFFICFFLNICCLFSFFLKEIFQIFEKSSKLVLFF
ncbi:MAG: hypothetical protein COT14_01575 [Candidatus Diapherotrites archaeon CG08_land_8_20_14_0_20_30_16]|nr:MAG: hypothetical protein COT14_01575 [Candidatus Diapherotrites archaeon CG08_land_8_20_14_0_20_30_16]